MARDRFPLRLIACLFLGFLACACSPDKKEAAPRDAGTIVLRLAESMPEDHPSAKAGDYLAALVHERSGGKIRIKVYYGGKLGTPEQVLEQLQFGGIAMARVNALDLAQTVPGLRGYFKPSSRTSGEAVMARLEAEKEPVADACLRERLVPLVFYYPDIRCVYSDEVRFHSAADFSGVRIGVGESIVVKEALKTLGAIPMDLISADTYKSLRSGYIHARETTVSEFVLSDDYPFVRHLTLTRYLAAPDAIIISPEVLNDLSAAERRMIGECAQDTYAFQKDLMDKFHIAWISRMKADEKDVVWEDERFKADVGAAMETRTEL